MKSLAYTFIIISSVVIKLFSPLELLPLVD